MFARGANRFTTRCLRTGLTLCFLLMLPACSKTLTRYQAVPVEPPADLLQDTEVVNWTPKTNGQLLRWAMERDKALMQCNADKAAVREYIEQLKSRVQ